MMLAGAAAFWVMKTPRKVRSNESSTIILPKDEENEKRRRAENVERIINELRELERTLLEKERLESAMNR